MAYTRRNSRRALGAAALVGATTLAAQMLGIPTSSAAEVTHAQTAYVTVVGTVNGTTYPGVVPANVNQEISVSTSCVVIVNDTPTACAAAGTVTYQWSNNSNLEGDSVNVSFDGAGMKTVQVTVTVDGGENLQASGSGWLVAAVTEPFADEDAIDQLNVSEAVTAVTAAGLMQPCRIDGNVDSARQGQAVFCPTPPAGLGRNSPYRIPNNAITQTNCLADPTSCGLPPGFDSGGQVASGLVSADGGVLVRPTVCVDNAVSVTAATNRGTNLVTRRGVEPGCASYADMLDAAAGTYPTSARTPDVTVASASQRTNISPNPVLQTNLQGWEAQNSTLTRTSVTAVAPGVDNAAVWTVQRPQQEDPSAQLTVDVGNVAAGRTYTSSLYVQGTGTERTLLVTLRDVNGVSFAQGTWLAPAEGWLRLNVTGIPMQSGAAQMLVSLTDGEDGDSLNVTGLMTETNITPSPFTTTSTPTICAQGPEPTQANLTGASVLNTARVCDTDAALLKGEAYRLAADLFNLSAGSGTVTATLQDIADPATREAVDAMLTAGAPLVGDLSCPSGTGLCFNSNQALTRSELARLLSFAVAGYTGSSDLKVTPTFDVEPLRLGVPTPVSVVVDVPTYYPGQSTVSVTGNSGIPGTFTCPTTNVTVPDKGQVTLACAYTPAATGPATLTVTATVTNLGLSATGAATGNVINDPPVITSKENDVAVALFSNEDEPGTSTDLYFYDPENLNVSVGVRSCNPAVDVNREGQSLCPTAGNIFPQTNKARTITPDNNPALLTNTANVELGTVAVSRPRNNTAVTVTFQPQDLQLWGTWSFVLQVCDSGAACSTRLYIIERASVNDPPIASPITVTTGDDPVTFQLAGSDEEGTVTAGRILDVDTVSGSLEVQQGQTWEPVLANTAYPIDSLYRWTPPNGPSNTWTTTFEVRDNGSGDGPALWSEPALLQLVRVRPVGPPVAALTVDPLAGPQRSTRVTFDAAASASEASEGIVSYLFNFGDGSTLGPVSSPTVTHRYSKTGLFTVTVTVTDSNGKTDSTSRTYDSRVNLVANPTLDNSINGWQPVGGLSSLQRITPGLNGSAGALRVSTGSGVCAVEEATPAVVGVAGTNLGPYAGSAWVKAPSGSVGKDVTMSLVETTPAGVNVAVSKRTVTLSSEKAFLQVNHTLSKDTNTLRIVFDVANPANGACLTVDDVGLTPPSP